MIKFFIIVGSIAIGLTALGLGLALIVLKIQKHRAKKKYQKLIEEKMEILAQLQEELTEEEAQEKDYSQPPQPPLSEAHLPANFFDTNYLEVKP